MSIVGVLAIIFFAMTVGGLLLMMFISLFLPEFVTTDWAEKTLKILGNTLAAICYIGMAGLVVTGIVAMCLYIPC